MPVTNADKIFTVRGQRSKVKVIGRPNALLRLRLDDMASRFENKHY